MRIHFSVDRTLKKRHALPCSVHVEPGVKGCPQGLHVAQLNRFESVHNTHPVVTISWMFGYALRN